MQDESMKAPGARQDMDESVVLDFLLDDHPGIWTLSEIGRALGSDIDGRDAVARLHRSGFVHRVGEFVFVSRAGVRARELER